MNVISSNGNFFSMCKMYNDLLTYRTQSHIAHINDLLQEYKIEYCIFVLVYLRFS